MESYKSGKTTVLNKEKNHSKTAKEEQENEIRRAHLLQLKKKCLTFGPQGRHYLGRVLRELRACGGDKKPSTKRTVGWTIIFTNQDEIDSPPEEDDSEPSETESDESVAKSPLNIRRFFLPSDSDDDEDDV